MTTKRKNPPRTFRINVYGMSDDRPNVCYRKVRVRSAFDLFDFVMSRPVVPKGVTGKFLLSGPWGERTRSLMFDTRTDTAADETFAALDQLCGELWADVETFLADWMEYIARAKASARAFRENRKRRLAWLPPLGES